jgi:nuclear migration protein JNM1
LPRLDPLIPVVPPLLARLRSLSGLHAEALGIAADLRILQSNDRNITEEERELQSIVSGVQQGVTEAAISISKNWESIQGRINQLEQRLQVLVD